MAYLSTRGTITTLLNRTLTQISTRFNPLKPRFSLSILQSHLIHPNPAQSFQSRLKTTGSGHSPINDPSPNWTNRPPRETILLDGCDYEHYLVIMEFPSDPKPSNEEMVDAYVKTLAQVVGSEEEAKKKIYSLSTTTYTGFGALISEELSYKVKGLPNVLWVLPDSYLDVPNKDYGGDLFIDGKVIRRPQFDFSERRDGNRHRPRPRHDRRRERVQNVGRVPMQPQPQPQPQSWANDRNQSMHQSVSMNGQNAPERIGDNPAMN